MPRAHQHRARAWGATICLQVVSPREAYNQYTRDIKYRTRREMTEELRRSGNERGMISRSSIRFYRALSNGDKSAFRRHKASSHLHLSSSALRSIIVSYGHIPISLPLSFFSSNCAELKIKDLAIASNDELRDENSVRTSRITVQCYVHIVIHVLFAGI